MKVFVVTACSPDYDELRAVTQPSKERWAKRHGYTFVHMVSEKQRGDACKYDAYKEVLRAGYPDGLFVYSDIDALVMNSDIAVEDICHHEMGWDPTHSMDAGCHFLWGYDFAGPNSGVYLARFTPQAHHFLDRSYATMLENGLADETAMEMTMLIPPFRDWVRVCRGTVLNAYPYEYYGGDRFGDGAIVNMYAPGMLMLHLPGYPNKERIPILTKFASEAT